MAFTHPSTADIFRSGFHLVFHLVDFHHDVSSSFQGLVWKAGIRSSAKRATKQLHLCSRPLEQDGEAENWWCQEWWCLNWYKDVQNGEVLAETSLYGEISYSSHSWSFVWGVGMAFCMFASSIALFWSQTNSQNMPNNCQNRRKWHLLQADFWLCWDWTHLQGGRYDFLKKAESGTMARAKIFMDRYFEDGAIYNGHLVGNSDLSFCSPVKNFKLTFQWDQLLLYQLLLSFLPILCHWYGCQVTWNLNPNTSPPFSGRTVVFRSISLATLTRGRWSWSFFPSKTM